METETRESVTRNCKDKGEGSSCLIGTEFQFCKMKEIICLDSSDGSMTMGMCLIAWNCTLKVVIMLTPEKFSNQ